MNRPGVVFLLAAAIAGVGLTATAETQTVKRTTLPNGLVIITKPVRTNGIVSVNVALRMGSLYESDDKAGLFTLMQNTVIKGTKTRSAEQIAEELESMGTRISASADREYGMVSIQSTAESFHASLAVLFDILRNASFPQDAVDLQKKIQTRNILTRRDQPLYRAVELMAEAQYGSHPFHKPLMGYPETVGTLTRDDLLASYTAVYIPNNMVIVVVGNFDEKRLFDEISRELGSMPAGRLPEPVKGDLPTHSAPVEKTESRETAANWLTLGWFAPSITDPDSYPMEVLDAVTGGSMNSRLFVAIREQRGLAYQVSSFLNARMATGIYATYIGTKPDTYNEAKKVLLDEVFRMKSEEVTPEELTLAKSYLRGMFIMGQESNAGQAGQYAQYEALGLGYKYGDRYLPAVDKVTAGDIVRVAKKYLSENYSLGAVTAKPQR